MFIGIVQVGSIPHEDIMAGIKLFGDKVMPAFK